MNVLEYLKDHILYLDGGMGTLLQANGLAAGELPERWNLSHADVITNIHTQYYNAGSNVVNTNTFGANSLKFSEEELEAIVRAAIESARCAARQSSGTQQKFVALDVGPTGHLLEPYGDLAFEDAVEVFAKTVRLGVRYGADLIVIETMNDSCETRAALLAAKENSNLPVFVSNAYGADGKLMTGADPCVMVAMLEGMGADVIGINCSLGPQALKGVVEAYTKEASVPVLLKPNAGLPKIKDGESVYDIDPVQFARDMQELAALGVHAMGGCCGTTPAYIAELVKATAHATPAPVTEKKVTRVCSFNRSVTLGERPVLIGECINPTAKPSLQDALRANDMDELINEALDQIDAGAQILDVNVSMPDIDERKTLADAIGELQTMVNLPLQIDTANADAMEAALRKYNGKALINSVTGAKQSMERIFPLAKKYGGVVVALTMDERGIPATAEERYAIAQTILETANEYGVAKKNIVFDPLVLTVGSDQAAAAQTLRAVEMIRQGLGCHTMLGISNISFGMPQRELLNSTFFAMALERGLSAAIVDPYSAEIHKTYRAFCALHGTDEGCEEYLDHARSLPQTR